MSALNNFLLGIPLFNNLGPFTITELAGQLETLKFAKRAVILEPGNECTRLYIVASGKLEFYKNFDDEMNIIIKTLNPGDIFGEDYFLNGLPTDGYLRAVNNSVVVTLSRETIDSVLKDNTTFFRNYISILNKKDMAKSESITTLLSILLSVDLHIPEPYIVRDIALEQISEVKSVENAEQIEDNNTENIFYQKVISCPLCSEKYQTLKARHKYTIVDRTDEDSCPYYNVINPMYYEINTCPHCGYSFNNATSNPVKLEMKDSINKVLANLYKGTDYTGTRSLEEAIQTFNLAAKCQWQLGANNYSLGRLFLKLGWLYRYKEEPGKEKEQMEKALHYLSKFYDKSEIQDFKEEMNLMFQIGQIHLNLNDKRGGIQWFIKITQHPERKKFPFIVNRSSELWQKIRRELKEEG